MKVKLILPALTEATSPFFRPVKYSLFPPLGLATLAASLSERDEVVLEDEHVQRLDLDDRPDLVAIEVYITAARRAYAIADHYRRRGAWVVLGGLHVTSLPNEAAAHADTVCLGPSEDTWPELLADFASGRPRPLYRARVAGYAGPSPRRDLIDRRRYLVPSSLVVSRGCPHTCDFCYTTSFFAGGRRHATRAVDRALAEVESLPGRHLYFLDDNLFGDPDFALALCHGLEGMGRLWQAAGTVAAIHRRGLMERAARAGLSSLFVGFETLDPSSLARHRKVPNLGADYDAAVRRLHDLGVMVNASFVFGMDEHDESVFERTVEWAISSGVETATFHVLTPSPGTPLFRRLEAEGRLLHRDWDLYDTRHSVFRPRRMTPEALEAGYWWAYREFYRWGSILNGARAHQDLAGSLRHLALAVAWKKVEPLWNVLVAARRLADARPLLEALLAAGGSGARAESANPAWLAQLREGLTPEMSTVPSDFDESGSSAVGVSRRDGARATWSHEPSGRRA